MGMLITCFLVLVNTHSTVMNTMPGSNVFTALDTWMLQCKVILIMAFTEYAFLLRIKLYLEQRQNKVKKSSSRNDKIWIYFPADPEQFCRYVDKRAEIVCLCTLTVYAVGYFVFYFHRLSHPVQRRQSSGDVA